MKFTISNSELAGKNNVPAPEFPKYTTQLINLANQNAQGTRPNVVGQMSEEMISFQKCERNHSFENWEKWYNSKHPNAITNATEKIFNQVNNLKQAILQIDMPMIEKWTKDLVINKTYTGICTQYAILRKLSEIRNQTFIPATPEQESQGIDGYVGNIAYSVKPLSYKTMNRLSESIEVKMVYYEKNKNGITVDVEEE